MSAVASSLPVHSTVSREGDGEEAEGADLLGAAAKGSGHSSSVGRQGSGALAEGGIPAVGAASIENSIDLLLPSAIMDALSAPEGHDLHSLSRLSQVRVFMRMYVCVCVLCVCVCVACACCLCVLPVGVCWLCVLLVRVGYL
jgi:hypothetical protein